MNRTKSRGIFFLTMALNIRHRIESWWILPLILSMLLYAEGKRFVVFDSKVSPPKVCSILDIDLTIVVTAVQGETILSSTAVTSNTSGIHSFGTCEHYIMISWPNDVHFHVTNQSPFIDFSVLFMPNNVFGELTPSTTILTFENLRKVKLQRKDSSYKCSKLQAEYYHRNSSEDITFTVFVTVNYVQVQLGAVINGTFSPSGPDCQDKDVTSSPPALPTASAGPDYFWTRNRINLTVGTVGLTCVVIAFGLWICFLRKRRIRAADQWQQKLEFL